MVNITKDNINLLGRLPCKKILIGGSALPFYGVLRGTADIDIEADVSSFEELSEMESMVKSFGLEVDITSDINGWDMIPLPVGFRDRLILTEISNLYILDTLDFISSKIRRGTIQDFQDCINVALENNLNESDIYNNFSLIELPIDPVSSVFNKKTESFLLRLSVCMELKNNNIEI